MCVLGADQLPGFAQAPAGSGGVPIPQPPPPKPLSVYFLKYY